jgi:phosphoribosylglycinamide formyltransferase-1
MKPLSRLVVLISGSGTNLQAILDACQQGSLPGEVVAVISNKTDAYGLVRAQAAGVPAVVLPTQKGLDRVVYDQQLADTVASFQPDWVVLAGWMRILTNTFLGRFPNRVINLHPALPGTFPGTHAIERAHQAYQSGLITSTGVMVHRVPDEGVDSGPVLAQQSVPILPEDTLETLESRIHAVEHTLLVNTIRELIQNESKDKGD